MTLAEKREQLRISLLRMLEANDTRFGQPEGVLYQMAKSEGRPNLQRDHVNQELRYLQGKGLVGLVGKAISPEVAAWQITAEGRDHLAMSFGDE